MEKVSIIENGIVKDIEVVRYFKYNNVNYLVYSLNEIDGVYSKIYISKVLQNIEVISEDEWNKIKEIIKEILKEISEGQLKCVEELDFNTLRGLNIISSKPFKLSTEMTNLFSKDKKIFNLTNNEVPKEQIISNNLSQLDNPINYKELYTKVKEENEKLIKDIEYYKNIVDQIKNLINN